MTGRIPLHVLTGFLGSGKTTLLNRIVRDPVFADSAVLINEIGAIALDHHLVQRMDSGDSMDIVVLQGGCTCCAMRGDLVEALRELYARRAAGTVPPFRRTILETTGLADPAPVLFTLVGDPVIRHKFEAGAIIATVDAVHGLGQLHRHPESRKQVAVADRLLITKGDIADPGRVATLTAELAGLNPGADIFDTQGLHSLAGLLETGATPGSTFVTGAVAQNTGSNRAMEVQEAEHTPAVAALSFTLDDPIEWAPFSVWLSLLLNAHGEKILRFKALLNVTGWSGPVVLDGIHHLIHAPIHLPAWPDGPRNSRLVVIAEGMAMPRIETSLRDFLATHGASNHQLQRGSQQGYTHASAVLRS